MTTVHAEAELAELISPDRMFTERGVHVVVHVTTDGNTAYARIDDPTSQGHRSQRWLKHARRGSSPGGWSEAHHPRSEQAVGEWKERHASVFDRALIGCSKQAWRLDEYAVRRAISRRGACRLRHQRAELAPELAFERFEEETACDGRREGDIARAIAAASTESEERDSMTTYAFAAPVLEGMTDKYRDFVHALVGARRDEAEAIRRTAGLDREQVFLQSTPMGDVALIVWETEDFQKVAKTFATDTSDFGAWFRSSVETVHGFDVTKVDMPQPVLVDEWKDASWSHGLDSWAFAYPVKDVAGYKAFIAQLLGTRRDEFASTRLDAGVKRASFFLLETPDGMFAVQYVQGEAGSFPKASQEVATSQEPLYVWWREQMLGFTAVPMFQGTPPQVEELIDLQVKVPAKA